MTFQDQMVLALILALTLITMAALYEMYRNYQRAREARDVREILRYEWTCPYTKTCTFKIKTNDEETLTYLRDSHIHTQH